MMLSYSASTIEGGTSKSCEAASWSSRRRFMWVRVSPFSSCACWSGTRPSRGAAGARRGGAGGPGQFRRLLVAKQALQLVQALQAERLGEFVVDDRLTGDLH